MDERKVYEARVLAQILFNSWQRVDRVLELPKFTTDSINELRGIDFYSQGVREYFREICYETLLLNDDVWSVDKRKKIPEHIRSEYLSGLVQRNAGGDTWADIIVDPAYRKWVSLKYASRGSSEATRWQEILEIQKNLALSDCKKISPVVEEHKTFPDLPKLTLRGAKEVFLDVISQRNYDFKVGTIPGGGIGVWGDIPGVSYYFSCKILDSVALARRIFPFELEIGAAPGKGAMHIAQGQIIWPGASMYRNVCLKSDGLRGICEVLVHMMKSLQLTAMEFVH